MKRNKTAVIGLGNPLLADEGAGLRAAELLNQRLKSISPPPAVDVVEAGTPGMNMLHQFQEREKIIFVDAGNLGLEAGQYRRFKPEEAVSVKKNGGFSLHEFDLMGFLTFAKEAGMANNVDVVIYGIQAAQVVMSENLSPMVEKGLQPLLEELLNEIKTATPNTYLSP